MEAAALAVGGGGCELGPRGGGAKRFTATMTVWHEATLPRVPGAEAAPADGGSQEPRLHKPYVPPKNGERASYLGRSPRRAGDLLDVRSDGGGSVDPWWWPESAGRPRQSEPGSLAALLTKQRLDTVTSQQPSVSSPGSLLASSIGAGLVAPPKVPPPKSRPVVCDPLRAAKERAKAKSSQACPDPPLPLAILADAIAQQRPDSRTGLTNVGIANVLLKRKMQRRQMQAEKYAAVWKACGDPKQLAEGEGVDLSPRPQAVSILSKQAVSLELKIAIPGVGDSDRDSLGGAQAASAATAGAKQSPDQSSVAAAELEASQKEDEAAKAAVTAAQALSEAQTAESAESKGLQQAKQALEAATEDESKAGIALEQATKSVAAAAEAEDAARSTETAAGEELEQAKANLEAQKAAEKAVADALNYQAVGLNAAGKKLNKAEKAQAEAAVADKQRALRAAPGSAINATVEQEAVSAAQVALDASTSKKERAQLEATLREKESQLIAAQSAGVARVQKEKATAYSTATIARQQAEVERQKAGTAEATAKSHSMNSIAMRQAAAEQLAQAEHTAATASERVQSAETQVSDAARQTQEAERARTNARSALAAYRAALAAYKAAQVRMSYFNPIDHPDAFCELQEQIQVQASVAVQYGPIVELSPVGLSFAEPLLMQFNVSAILSQPMDNAKVDSDKAILLVLRQDEPNTPWVPLETDEHLSMEVGDGRIIATLVTNRPPARLAALLFRGSTCAVAAAEATSHALASAAARVHTCATEMAKDAKLGQWMTGLVSWGTVATGVVTVVPTGHVAGLALPAVSGSTSVDLQGVVDHPQSVSTYVSCLQSKLASFSSLTSTAALARSDSGQADDSKSAAQGLGAMLVAAMKHLATMYGLNEIHPQLVTAADQAGVPWFKVEAYLLLAGQDETARVVEDPATLMRNILTKEAASAVTAALAHHTTKVNRAAASAFWQQGMKACLAQYDTDELKGAMENPAQFVTSHYFTLLWNKLKPVAEAREIDCTSAEANIRARVSKKGVPHVVACVSENPEIFFGRTAPPMLEVPGAGGKVYRDPTELDGEPVLKSNVRLVDLQFACDNDIDRAVFASASALLEAGRVGGSTTCELGGVVKILPPECTFDKANPPLRVTLDVLSMVEEHETLGDVCFVALRKLTSTSAWVPLSQGEQLVITQAGQAHVDIRTTCWLALFMIAPATQPPAGTNPAVETLSLHKLLQFARLGKHEQALAAAGYTTLSDIRDLYEFGTPQRVLHWSEETSHSAEHLSRWYDLRLATAASA